MTMSFYRRIIGLVLCEKMQKGLVNMSSEEMVSLFLQTSSTQYDQVTPPLNEEGENPIFLALTKKTLPWQYHFYELFDAKAVVSSLCKISDVFFDDHFMMSAFKKVDLSNYEKDGKDLVVEVRELIPHTASSTQLAIDLYETDWRFVEYTYLINKQAEIVGFNEILQQCKDARLRLLNAEGMC